MKTYFGTMLRGALALTAMLVCGSGVSNAAAPVSPVGTWDCTLTGPHGQKGIAFLTFSDNGTNRSLDGFQLQVANPTSSTPDPNVRNVDSEQGRITGLVDSSSGSTNGGTTVIGFGEIKKSPWSYDTKGRVVGYFIQPVLASGEVTNYIPTCVTNQLLTFSTLFPGDTNGTLFVTNVSFCFDTATATFTTNLTFTVPTNATFTFTTNNPNFTVANSTVEKTNQISFVGKVSGTKHLTLKCDTSFGNLTYQGSPYTKNLKDLTGSWQATRKENGQSFLETFDLISFATGNPFDTNSISDTITNFPNIYYTTNNAGPGYNNQAVAALSLHKKIGFEFIFGPDPQAIRASLGSFSSTKSATKANTKGIELPSTSFTFKANLVP